MQILAFCKRLTSFNEKGEYFMEKQKVQQSKKEELINKIKTVEINKSKGLVFFGTCHCSGGKHKN